MNFKGREYKLSVILPWIAAVIKDYKLKLILCVVLGWAIVGLNFVFVWLTKIAIDSATGDKNHNVIVAVLAGLALTIAIQALISAVSRRLRTMTSFRMNRRLQERLFEKAVYARWPEINKYHTGDITRRLEEDGAEIISFVSSTIPTILLVLLQLLGAYIFLIILSYKIAIVLAIIMVVGVFISKFHFLKIRAFSAKIKEGGSMLQAALQEGLQNISVLKALAGNRLFMRYYSHIFGLQEDNVRRRLSYTVLSSTILNVGFAACYLFVFVWGVFGLESSSITYGTLIAFVQLVGQIQGPSRTLISSISDFAEFYTSCERLNEISSIKQEHVIEPSAISLTTAPGIICRDLSYSYTQGGRKILDHFNCEFAPKSFNAIIGTTGAGKTTLIRLLLSYIEPDEGEIFLFIDGRKERVGINTRSAFAYVPQGNSLFSMSLRDNLRLSNPQATDYEMKRVLSLSCADFIMKHKEGLDTMCGENGRGFSQGQAQRFCIARALLSKAPVLLFDEATSALDHGTEELIIKNIKAEIRDKTILFITHRDAVMKYADKVIRVN